MLRMIKIIPYLIYKFLIFMFYIETKYGNLLVLMKKILIYANFTNNS